MVNLLRQAGISANIVTGQIRVNASMALAWTGLPATAKGAVADYFNAGRTPIANNNYALDTAGNFSYVDIGHFWVRATIDGMSYDFDPSYKPHTQKTPIDLNAITGYNQASFLTNAKVG